MSRTKSILFISQVSPLPTNGGDRLRSINLIKAIVKLNYHVTAIVGNIDTINFLDYNTAHIEFIEYPLYQDSKFNVFKKNQKLIDIINSVIANKDINTVFLDYGFQGQYIKWFKSKKINVIYGTHNAQSNLTDQWKPKKIKSKISKYIQLFMQQLHEKVYFKYADKLIVVSEEDKLFHSSLIEKDRITVIPNFLDEVTYEKHFRRENYIVMSGNFETYQNSEGLCWFLNHVWNDELAAQTRLVIVGKGSDKLEKNGKNIQFMGMVDDILPIIGKARVSIVPLLHGSGSRLKILEAMALNIPIVSTAVGCEGIEHNNKIKISDTAEQFYLNVEDLIKNQEPIDLKSEFIQKYSTKSILSDLKVVVEF